MAIAPIGVVCVCLDVCVCVCVGLSFPSLIAICSDRCMAVAPIGVVCVWLGVCVCDGFGLVDRFIMGLCVCVVLCVEPELCVCVMSLDWLICASWEKFVPEVKGKICVLNQCQRIRKKERKKKKKCWESPGKCHSITKKRLEINDKEILKNNILIKIEFFDVEVL